LARYYINVAGVTGLASNNLMNIIISHVYSTDNKGDAALLGVLVQETQKKFHGAKITILSMDQVDGANSVFDDVPVKPSFMHFTKRYSSNRAIWLVYGTSMATYTLFWAFVHKKLHMALPISKKLRGVIDTYETADLIIPVGGGYLRTKPQIGSLYDFMMLLHSIILSRILKKPTVLYSQSVGPLYRKIDRWMLSMTIKHAVELAIIRESKSMKLLEDMGVTNCARSVDAGFLLESSKATGRAKLHLPSKRIVIGVTARKWLDDTAQHAYEKAMADTLDYLVREHDAYIVFIPQVTSEYHGDDDRVVSKAIFDEMTEKEHALVLIENYDYREIKAIYDQLDYLLGTRFHSVIFSLTSYVPAVAIEYEHKTSGIMHDLGLDDWVVKMEDVTPEVLKPKMSELIKARELYKKQLEQVLPAYIQQAHEAINMTQEAFLSFGRGRHTSTYSQPITYEPKSNNN